MLRHPAQAVEQITKMQREAVARWHHQPIDNPFAGLLGVACQQHQFNFLRWHEEDLARSPEISNQRVAEVKRAIDHYNQRRNDWIEKLDDYLIETLTQRRVITSTIAPLNTETPGSAIDRLSIMALRLYHLHEQLERPDASSEHRQKVQTRLELCYQQHADLSRSLGELLEDIFAGRKRLRPYRQMKMYNDPMLNPYLSCRPKRRAG